MIAKSLHLAIQIFIQTFNKFKNKKDVNFIYIMAISWSLKCLKFMHYFLFLLQIFIYIYIMNMETDFNHDSIGIFFLL